MQDTIHVYNTITFETLHVLKGHQGQVTCVSWSLDDLKLASCADNGSLYEWNVATGDNMINTRSTQTRNSVTDALHCEHLNKGMVLKQFVLQSTVFKL